jgi:hypothetical protein
MSKTPQRPFLIAKDDEGHVRITERVTRYNSQNYPIVTSTLQPETFKTITAAKAFAKEHLGAQDGDFASK